VQLHVPTPFLHSGRIVITGSSDDEEVIMDLQKLNEVRSQSSSWEKIIFTDIAAGVDYHHDLVMVLTVTVSLLGAWRILCGMSRVTVWE